MLPKKEFTFTGTIKQFPQKGGWTYVSAPDDLVLPLKIYADRGLVAIRACVNTNCWNTSLLPYGDGTLFVALPKKIRAAAALSLGTDVTVTFTLRER